MHATPPCIVVMRGRGQVVNRGECHFFVVFVLKGWQISNPLPEQACFKAKVEILLLQAMLTAVQLHEDSW